MTEIRYSQSLRARVMAFMGMLFLALAILIVASILFFIYTTEQNTWRARQTEATGNAVIKVADYLQKNETLLLWLDKYEFDKIKNNPDILQEILKDNPAFLEITFVDKGGTPIMDAARTQPTLANQFTILQSEWFRVANSGQKIYTRVQTSPQNESYIIFAMPSQHGGVLAAQIQMDALWNTVAEIQFGETGRIYIVNQNGQVIAHPNSQIVLSNQNIGDTALFEAILQSPGEKWIGNALNFEGVKVVNVSMPVELTEWIVISELPQEEAYAASRQASTLIPVLVIFLMIIVTITFRRMLDRVIMQPLNLLRQGANQVGQGNLSHRIAIPRKDELGEVMGVFNGMAADLEKQQDNLQKALAYEYETKRANDLARSNSIILALSKVAAQLDSSSDSFEIFDTVGKELKKLEMDSIVGVLDDSKQTIQIRYVSIEHQVVRWVEKMTGHSVRDLAIPRHLWPNEKVITEKAAYWDPNLMKGTLNMFPIIPEKLHKAVIKMAGISMDDPVIYLPLANKQEALGVLAVWGAGLKQSDVSALSIVANQVATAIRNSQLYETEARRGREKEILLKEIHHRVKNNLQIISSLLNLQTDQVKDTGTLRALRDSQARVRSMALIHEKLYQSKDLAKIEFGEYVQSLAKDLFRSYQRALGNIKLNIQVDEIALDLDYAVPCGLILNELMTNTLKYAFPNGRDGSIQVELHAGPGQTLSLRVTDDGVGIPADLDIFNNKSLGLQLVNSLVKQVDGKLVIENSKGTSFLVSFKY
ncbi:MAG: HAMP domain-containing protein [Chloroflexi bacterium]|nr:HAMP domain-containing protein [Chloroflexota bacterium]